MSNAADNTDEKVSVSYLV